MLKNCVHMPNLDPNDCRRRLQIVHLTVIPLSVITPNTRPLQMRHVKVELVAKQGIYKLNTLPFQEKLKQDVLITIFLPVITKYIFRCIT